ncbi:MAG: HEPN domain-containing protein [Syntrophobacteraceae bacterium]
MGADFRKYLEANQIYISQGIEKSIPQELEAARNDLAVARRSMEIGDYKWSTAQACQAMFHAGRALLYSEGYKERAQESLFPALESLFIETGRLSSTYLENFAKARTLRDNALNNQKHSKKRP